MNDRTGKQKRHAFYDRVTRIRPAGCCRTSKAHVKQVGTYNLNEGENIAVY
jgi:hypothetical protein